MTRVLWGVAVAVVAAVTVVASLSAQLPAPVRPGSGEGGFVPVTDAMLANPGADDWLMYSRTYDAQRFSPLTQINRGNVVQLRQVFKKEFGKGTQESIPLVYRGVMYVVLPGAALQALDAATGDVLWEHKRSGGQSRTKTLAIYEDMVYWMTPDTMIVALDAKTGAVRWETKTSGGMTSGPIVVEGKVVTGRACSPVGENCYIAAHDARTGKEVWRFRTAAPDSDPGGASWGGAPEAGRMAATWGLPGGYDPVRRLIYWGVANPMPNTRADRHGGNTNAIPTYSPADLYSNSTIALNPETGKLAWYYQHLPGDDWDQDYTNERVLFRTAITPDPKFVKWINPNVKPGEQRDVTAMVGEGGGLFVNDRVTGEFLWATPFPRDTPNFLISNIEGNGRVHLNTNVMFKGPNDRHAICFWNTRSYWPTAYHPRLNSLYIPYVENCLDMTSAGPGGTPRERRGGIPRDGVDMDKWAGVAKVNMATGEIAYFQQQRAPSNGAALATAGDVVFWGDLAHKFRAMDAESGKTLWEHDMNGPVQNSTITYAVNGKQYVAVLTGEGLTTAGLFTQAEIKANRGYNSLTVFALP